MKYFPIRLFAAGAAALMALSGAAEAQDLTEITVGVSPAIFSASVFLAKEEGIFEKHGLPVSIVTIQSGAEAVPKLVNGTFDISMGDPVGTSNVFLNGVPYLADRVFVFPGRPARGKPTSLSHVIPVSLGRKRDQISTRAHPEFGRLRTQVQEIIMGKQRSRAEANTKAQPNQDFEEGKT